MCVNADVSLLTSLELSLRVVSTCAIARQSKEIVSLIWLQLRSGLTALEPGLGNGLDVATLRTPECLESCCLDWSRLTMVARSAPHLRVDQDMKKKGVLIRKIAFGLGKSVDLQFLVVFCVN